MAVNKTHILKGQRGRRELRKSVETYCGLIGSPAPSSDTEYDTAHGMRRFEAVPPTAATCIRCLKSSRDMGFSIMDKLTAGLAALATAMEAGDGKK